MKISKTTTALAAVVITLGMTACSSSPDRNEQGYEKVSQQMNKNYPGEGWDDRDTTRKATNNVCDGLDNGNSENDIRREFSKDSDAAQANALVSFATEYVCPQDS